MQRKTVPASLKNESTFPLQKLLEGDFLRVMPLHEHIHLSVVPHRHDHYELLYITGGQGVHFINFKAYDVRPGRLYFLHPGQTHLIDRYERNGWLIMFGPELFERFLDIHRHEDELGLLDSYAVYPYVDLDVQTRTVFELLIQQLLHELSAGKPDHDILMHYTALLMLQANRLHALQHPELLSASMNRFDFYKLKRLIDAHLTEQHSAGFYADKMNLDIKKLNRICRESTGNTVAGLLKERLVTESKIQLQTSSSSVKEIAYELGFNDPAFFGRFFKKHTRYTPQQFRELRLI